MSNDLIGDLYASFAALLSYPTPAVRAQAEECLDGLKGTYPEVAIAFERFLHGLKQRSIEELQELYTTTFDMQPVCYPYIGYQLFGESYKRGAFMAQLNEAYRARGFSAGGDLPDHLSVVLRFLGLDATEREGKFCQALLHSGLLPALEKMLKPFGAQSENPYFWLLSALQQFLVWTPEKELGHA